MPSSSAAAPCEDPPPGENWYYTVYEDAYVVPPGGGTLVVQNTSTVPAFYAGTNALWGVLQNDWELFAQTRIGGQLIYDHGSFKEGSSGSRLTPSDVTVNLVSPTQHGVLVLHPSGEFQYQPNPGFTGDDSFTYRVQDSNGVCSVDTATVYLTVQRKAMGVPDTYETPANQTLALPGGVLINDIFSGEGQKQAHLETGPTKLGSAGEFGLLINGQFSYKPDPSFVGTDEFTYRAAFEGFPSNLFSAITKVTIHVTPFATAAVDRYYLEEDETLTVSFKAIGLLANDATSPGATVSVVKDPLYGDVSLNADGTLTFEPLENFYDGAGLTQPQSPPPGWVGEDYFLYKSCVGEVCSDPTPVFLNVSPVDDPPSATDDVVDGVEKQAVTFSPLGNDFDIDDRNLFGQPIGLDPSRYYVKAITQPAHGAVTQSQPHTLTYTPTGSFAGLDSFKYRVCDNQFTDVCSAEASINLTIQLVNDAPVAVDDVVSTLEDTPKVLNLGDNDQDEEDGSPLEPPSFVFQVQSQAAHGSVTGGVGQAPLTYEPAENYSGPDAITYRVCEFFGVLCSATANVNIEVEPVNDPPVAVDDAFSTDQGVPIDMPVGANDHDIEAGPQLGWPGFRFETEVAPAHGSLSGGGQEPLRYSPVASFAGTDSFEYRACEVGASPASCSAPATAIITVKAAPPSPPGPPPPPPSAPADPAVQPPSPVEPSPKRPGASGKCPKGKVKRKGRCVRSQKPSKKNRGGKRKKPKR
jgi:hypothetical protein